MEKYVNPIPSVEDEEERRDNIEYGTEYDYKTKVFFAFIDVLGFKNAFDEHRECDDSETDADGEEHKNIAIAKRFQDVFVYYFELMNATNIISQKEKTGCYAGQTSDSLYFYSPREDWLLEYIKVFLHLNLYAMSQDVFFRGGIAKGNLFVKDPYQFYGESVIYSYLLESEISKFPIIVVDENTYEAIKDFPETKTLVKEMNGRHYLNIFAPLSADFELGLDEEAMIIVREIDEEQILRNIKKNKGKFEYSAKNHEKYAFLLREYQKYIEQRDSE